MAIVYSQTIRHEFVIYDDLEYVCENEWVTGGLSFDSVLWAFVHTYASNWHPLTWVSHTLDWQLYGSWAGGHHLTSVVIHTLTAIVLYFALAKLTGDARPSAAVAILWAVHPLRVESVAWVAERKDVLCGLFFALSLLAYARYAERQTRGRFLAVAVTLTLGLLAKSMLVTAPCVYLLLDFWPLGRFRSWADVWPLLREKLPLFALSIGASLATFAAQDAGGSVATLESHPFEVRAKNALVSYVDYAAATLYPVELAVFYPHLGGKIPTWQWIAAAFLLCALTAGLVASRRRFPFLLVGWLWFLGMLVPVIGLVQVGEQSHADRYTYLPQIGLLIALVWGVHTLAPSANVSRAAFVRLLFLAVVVTFTLLSWRQVTHWKNSETLFVHTLSCTTDNVVAHGNLGNHYSRQRRLEEAVQQFEAGHQIAPHSDRERNHLTSAYLKFGEDFLKRQQPELAMAQFRRAEVIASVADQIRTHQALINAYTLQGTLLAARGQLDEAIAAYRVALVMDPRERPIRRKLAAAYLASGEAKLRAGSAADAIVAFRAAVEVDPTFPDAQKRLDELLPKAQP